MPKAVLLALLALLVACAPQCDPQQLASGFVAEVSSLSPLMVHYDTRIPLRLIIAADSRLLAHDGSPITEDALQLGQRMWLRGIVQGASTVQVRELRLLPVP